MLQLKEICHSFGENKVLQGVSCSLPPSKIYGLLGPSGGGKSTLLKIIAQVLEANSGEVSCGGIDNKDISLMFQEGALFDSLTVFDNVAFPLVDGRVPSSTLSKVTRIAVRDKVAEILHQVGLSKASQKMPGQLSGGMCRRVSLARALVCRPKLLLLDDPTCGLDPVASSVIMSLIERLHGEYLPTTIIASHDLRRLLPVVDSVLALFEGEIAFDGTVNELVQTRHDSLRTFVSCRYDMTERTLEHSPE